MVIIGNGYVNIMTTLIIVVTTILKSYQNVAERKIPVILEILQIEATPLRSLKIFGDVLAQINPLCVRQKKTVNVITM